MRGYDYDKFPSDHNILPIEFVNKKGPPAIVRQPILFLKESSEDFTKPINGAPPITYYVAGHYPEISDPTLQKPFIQSQAYLIGGHSAKQLNLIFHVEYWWDYEKHKDKYNYKFEANKSYVLKIRYLDKDNECYEADIGGMNTLGVNCFKPKWEMSAAEAEENKETDENKKMVDECKNRYLWWDFHPIELGHQNNKQVTGITSEPYICKDELQWENAFAAANNKKK